MEGRESSKLSMMDRISALPDMVIQHVQSFLPTKEAARTSLLSRTWLRSWSTHPRLDFRQSYFGAGDACKYCYPEEYPDVEEKRQKFVKFVDANLLRYREEKLRIEKLRIHITVVDIELFSLVDKWIGIAAESGVQDLDIYSLPIFDKFLMGWVVFTLPSRIFKVRGLTLSGFVIDDGMLQRLNSSSPLIETLILHYCNGFKNFQVANLHRLRQLDIETLGEAVEIFDTEAPSLESFAYEDGGGLRLSHPCHFNIGSSRNLKRLKLCVSITDMSYLNNLLSNFPVLEDLSLNCGCLKGIKISSPFLKRCGLCSSGLPSISFTHSRPHLKIDLCIPYRIHNSWFLNFRNLLTKSSSSKVTLRIENAVDLDIDDLKAIPLTPTPDVEELSLMAVTLLDLPDFVDALLWSCHPKFLIVHGFCNSNIEEVGKVLCEKLIDRIDPNCCNSQEIKSLNNVEIEVSGLGHDKWRPFKVRSLVDVSLAFRLDQKVRFKLQW